MANFYRRPLIYLPKKKKVTENGGSTQVNFGGYDFSYSVSKGASGVYSDLYTFWTTPQSNRTPSLPPLYLYDPVTHLDQQINFSSDWTTSSHRYSVLAIRPSSNAANVGTKIWVDGKGWWSNIVLDHLYLYVSFPQATSRLYKLESSNLWDYRMIMHSERKQIANETSAYVYTVRADSTQFSAIINNSAVQDAISGSNNYNTYLIYIHDDMPQSSMESLVKSYWGGGSSPTMETLQI